MPKIFEGKKGPLPLGNSLLKVLEKARTGSETSDTLITINFSLYNITLKSCFINIYNNYCELIYR